ncbi:MAG: phage tail protein [Flavobacterium sp.]|nr:phage tail protein [Flavobacterium sp.]
MDTFIGQIIMFAGNFAPRDWAFCDGELLPISQNQSLYSILGTTYGGDGRTTFGLPDFRGRVPIGQGQGNGLTSRIMGEQIGIEDITLSTAQMPIHSHAAETTISGSSVTAKLKASSAEGTTNVPLNNYLAKPSNIGLQSINMYDSSADIEMASDAIEIDLSAVTANTTTDDTGGNSAHNNIQPSLVMNYIICVNGVYPSRS